MRAKEFITENFGRYPEIEFVCVNKDVPGSTDPKDQEALFQSLKKVPGIVAYRQDFDDDEDQFSGGKSLAVIIVKGGNVTAKKVKALAAQHNVKIDLTADNDDRFIDRLYTGSEPAVTDWFDNSIDRELDETISTGQGGGSAGNNGGSMVGGPTTYEEEYGMFKSKGPRRITAMTNEALDSYYPYEEYSAGKYHFVTDNGVKYKVYLQGKDMVEVAFSAILPGEEENFRPDKTTLTGTGDSRKVFGTVVKIVKEYLNTHKPNALYFTGENSEPSRIKLYNRLIAQVDKELPDYKALGNIDLGTGTAYMLRRKEKAVNEALDSSYDYRPGKYDNVFYFDTENGQAYKVQIGRAGKAAEVALFARGQDDEHKTGITGTGNAGKVFGTVVNIVKDYISKNNVNTILFTASNDEPSRVKLYNTLASRVGKVLPDYTYVGPIKNGNFTQFTLKHNNAFHSPTLYKAKELKNKALDAVFEDKTTLTDIYNGDYPDHDELIWNYIGTSDLDTPFTIQTINPNMLSIYLTSQYRIEHIEELFDMMDEDQRETVEHYENDPSLSDQIIVMNDGRIIDGNHRALAAVLSNRPIKYIDVSEDV